MRSPRTAASVLLVDIGNTRIKWALWQAGRLGRQSAAVYAGWSSAEFARYLFQLRRAPRAGAPDRIIVASVAAESVLRRLAAAAHRANRAGAPPRSRNRTNGAAPERIATSRRAAGVVTRYREPWRLGVDRFLGVIAAHHLAAPRAACVINAGTAVTVDLVDAQGVHRGGAILPGPGLMIESLLQRTAGIARRAGRSSRIGAIDGIRGDARGSRPGGLRRAESRAVAGSAAFFARDTAAAIEQGAAHAVAGAVERAIADARRQLGGAAPLVVLTGGGAAKLRGLLRVRCVEVPDLVLRGIALHAGLALR